MVQRTLAFPHSKFIEAAQASAKEISFAPCHLHTRKFASWAVVKCARGGDNLFIYFTQMTWSQILSKNNILRYITILPTPLLPANHFTYLQKVILFHAYWSQPWQQMNTAWHASNHITLAWAHTEQLSIYLDGFPANPFIKSYLGIVRMNID